MGAWDIAGGIADEISPPSTTERICERMCEHEMSYDKQRTIWSYDRFLLENYLLFLFTTFITAETEELDISGKKGQYS